jgi:hypothetical protein
MVASQQPGISIETFANKVQQPNTERLLSIQKSLNNLTALEIKVTGAAVSGTGLATL